MRRAAEEEREQWPRWTRSETSETRDGPKTDGALVRSALLVLHVTCTLSAFLVVTMQQERKQEATAAPASSGTAAAAAAAATGSGQPGQEEGVWRSACPEDWFQLVERLDQLSVQKIEAADVAASIDALLLPASCDQAAVRGFFDSHPAQAHSLVMLARLNATPNGLSRFVVNAMAGARSAAMADEQLSDSPPPQGDAVTAQAGTAHAAPVTAAAASPPLPLPCAISPQQTSRRTPTIEELRAAGPLPWEFVSKKEWDALTPQQRHKCCEHLDLQRRFKLSSTHEQQLLLDRRMRQEPGVCSIGHSSGTLSIAVSDPLCIEPLQRKLPSIMAECDIEQWWQDDVTFEVHPMHFDAASPLCVCNLQP